MSFRNKADRIRSNRNGQPALGQRAGNTADARARRGIEAELNAGQRIGRGVEVDKNGRQQVRTDATIHIDRKNRHSVVADSLRFSTPVQGSQAATKDYVDTAIGDIVVIGDSEYVVEYNRPPAGPSISTTTSWKAAPTEYLYDHNNTVSPSNPAAVYAVITHTGTGDECVFLYPGYVYGIALSLRCYQSAFELSLLYSATIGATAWNVYPGSVRFTQVGDTTTVYLLLDNTAGAYTYVTPAFRRYQTGTAIVSTVRMHARRLHPHYEGGYPALPLPGLPDAPEAGFEAESATLLAFRDELFSNLSTGNVTSVVWDFGDRYGPGIALHGSPERNPVYRYEAGGTLPVSITATGDGGSDTYTANVTVQDVVCTENILASVGILDAADFDDLQSNVASQSVSSIAAPDGTLTAIETVATSSTVSPVIQALLFETTGTYTQIGDLWQDGLAWTCAIYAYMGQANAARITLQARTMTTAGVQSDQVAVTVQGGSVASFTSSSTGAVSYSAERNARVEAVGDTGWYRIELTLQDYARTCDRIYLAIFGSSGSAYDRHITWNPTLRYGDWVARDKNRVTSGDDLLSSDWNVATATVTRSDEVTPAGTSSAVLIVPDAGTSSMNDRRIAQAWETLGTAVGRVTVSAYFKDAGMGYAALGLSNNGGYHATATFDLATGTATLGTHPTPGSDLASAFEDVGDGWKLCSFTLTMPAGTHLMATACFSGSTAPGASPYARNITGDGINGVHIWGARVHIGNPADWETVLPFVSGPQNLLGDGSDYTGGYWTKDASVTITANAQVAPNGRLEADDITRAVDADDFRVFPAILGSLITGKLVRYVFYVKPPSGLGSPSESIEMYLADDPYTTVYEMVVCRFDYSAPASPALLSISSSSTSGPGYTADDVTITPISNGWSRIQIDLFDYSSNAERVVIRHYGRFAANRGSAYTVSYWGSEVTTIDPLDPV